MEMYIVTSNSFRYLLKNIEDFKIDLGKRFTSLDNKGRINLTIKDPFVKLFKDKYNYLVYKIGYLGTINFYTCNKLSQDQIIIYDENNKEYIFKYDDYLASQNTEKYLASLIKQVC